MYLNWEYLKCLCFKNFIWIQLSTLSSRSVADFLIFFFQSRNSGVIYPKRQTNFVFCLFIFTAAKRNSHCSVFHLELSQKVCFRSPLGLFCLPGLFSYILKEIRDSFQIIFQHNCSAGVKSNYRPNGGRVASICRKNRKRNLETGQIIYCYWVDCIESKIDRRMENWPRCE